MKYIVCERRKGCGLLVLSVWPVRSRTLPEKYGLAKFPEILNEIKKKEEKLGHVSRERPPSLRPAVFYF